METSTHRKILTIDDYEVSATFAEKGDANALSHAKQILLSSFANGRCSMDFKGTVAIPPERSDNIVRGNPCEP